MSNHLTKNKEQKLKKQDTIRLLLVLLLLLFLLFISYIMDMMSPGENTFTHLFYIPVMLSAAWFRKKAYILTIVLSIFHLFHEFGYHQPLSFDPAIRILALFVITYVMVSLSEKNKSLQESLVTQLSTVQLTTDSAGDIIGRCDSNGNIVYISPSVERILGYSQDEMKNHSIFDYMLDPEKIQKLLIELLSTSDELREEIQFLSKSNCSVYMNTVFSSIKYNEAVTGVVFMCHDVSERIYDEISVKEELYLDELTKIHNRKYIDEVFKQEIAHNDKDPQYPFSILMLDIDHFKHVNDTFGHPEGDQVLIKIADIMKNALRSNDYLARYGGEEFLIILPNTDIFIAWDVAERIRKKIAMYSFPKVNHLTISIGLTAYIPNTTQQKTYEYVDQALYMAKNRGRNCVAIFSHFNQNVLDILEVNWEKEYTCGEDKIDEQHIKLIQKINSFVKNHQEKITVSELTYLLSDINKDLMSHFTFEEYLLRKYNYPNLGEHERIHNQIIADVEHVITVCRRHKMIDSVLLYQMLLDIIIGHMETEDKKFFYLFQDKQ